jgi:Na+-transporting NADH:ubiquinone oxidoreductase subunit B
MKFLQDIFDKMEPQFQKGGKFEKLSHLWEAQRSFIFTPKTTSPSQGAQIRDAIDLKRLMMTVVIALIPCLLFGIWNTGNMHFLSMGKEATHSEMFLFGLWEILPIIIVSYAAGGIIEVLFSIIRDHPVTEGFLVTGILIPMIVPATIPLWQVAVGTIFAVVLAKEVFGGVGMNILNVALTTRAFLFFAYPSEISGSEVWISKGDTVVEGFSGATPLGIAAELGTGENQISVLEAFSNSFAPDLFTFKSMFIGTIPGSIGETSALMCLIGGIILLITGVGSWRIMLSMLLGGIVMGLILNFFGANEFLKLPFYYHLVMGGFAFGLVFMATDPVTASQTDTGKWIYGFFCGILAILIRVLNPAYPEGVMLAILLMNVFAPLIDYYVVNANKNKRLKRAAV